METLRVIPHARIPSRNGLFDFALEFRSSTPPQDNVGNVQDMSRNVTTAVFMRSQIIEVGDPESQASVRQVIKDKDAARELIESRGLSVPPEFDTLADLPTWFSDIKNDLAARHSGVRMNTDEIAFAIVTKRVNDIFTAPKAQPA